VHLASGLPAFTLVGLPDTEVKEARDRYANMEVSYLLARIEDHHGPCILTTNLRSQIDKAFSRRFQLVVEFPRPDVAARAELWRRMLPPRAPLHEQVDTAFLASAVNLTGGMRLIWPQPPMHRFHSNTLPPALGASWPRKSSS